MVEVDVKTGSSALLTDAGVDVLGGSHRSGSCCTAVFWVGPSGWYGMNKSVPEEEDEGWDGASWLERVTGDEGTCEAS